MNKNYKALLEEIKVKDEEEKVSDADNKKVRSKTKNQVEIDPDIEVDNTRIGMGG